MGTVTPLPLNMQPLKAFSVRLLSLGSGVSSLAYCLYISPVFFLPVLPLALMYELLYDLPIAIAL
jgi:hypothetical protein